MSTPLECLRRRYETTAKKCPTCGYVGEEGHWTSHTDGRRVVYRHDCPSCDASREHVFSLIRDGPLDCGGWASGLRQRLDRRSSVSTPSR